MKALFSDYKLLFLCFALMLYAAIGAPTADHPGWIEGIIVFLFIISLGLGVFVNGFKLKVKQRQPFWVLAAHILFIFGLSVPVIIAVINGAEFFDIIRDLIGFLFLIVPLFLCQFLKTEKRKKVFILLCVFVGFVFSIRTLFPDNILTLRGDELLYLANSPLVLFTSIFLMGQGSKKLFEKGTLKNFLLFFIFFIGAIICLMAMMDDIRRASFVAVIISMIFLGGIGFYKNPLRVLLPLMLLALTLFLFQQEFQQIVQQITLKTSQVGMNMRMQEWLAVWDVVSADWRSFLFGLGWGAVFESPAVGGLPVTFTHSLLSALLLKSGMIGLLLCLVYLFFIFEKLMDVVFSNPVMGLALFWSFVIPVLFYASYKSLDFGLLLTLILICHNFKKPFGKI